MISIIKNITKIYKKWCDEYFYLPHRKEPRGIGGIFDYKKDNWEKDFSFVREVGISFKNIFREIIVKKYKKKWTIKQKEIQLEKKEVDTLNLTYFTIEVPNSVYKPMVTLRLF